MKNAFFLSLKDIQKSILFILFFYIQITVCGIIIIIAALEIPNILEFKLHLSLLDQHNAVVFKSYYKASTRIASMPSNVQNELTNIYDVDQIAFSISNAYNYSIPEYPDQSVIIIVGNFAALYPIGLSLPQQAPIAYLGADVKNIPLGSSFTFSGETSASVQIVGVLNPKSAFFHRTFEQALDNTIVILSPYKTLNELFGTYLDEELIQNTTFLDTSPQRLKHYVSIVNQSKIINVLPYSAVNIFEEQYKTNISSQWFFLVFFVIAFIMSTVGIIANIINHVNRSLREFAIHYLYGATAKDIFARVVCYTLFAVLPPIIFVFWLSLFMNVSKAFSSWILLVFFLCFTCLVIVSVLIYPYKKLKMIYLQDLLRRD